VPVPLTQSGNVSIAGDTITVNGNDDKDLGRIDRERLNLIINGSADVRASGRVGELKLTLAGSGAARLDGMAVTDAEIALSGSGNARIAATGHVKVRITGSGNVRLLKKPTSLEQQTMGSGEVIVPGR
jgi:hypothetical protein